MADPIHTLASRFNSAVVLAFGPEQEGVSPLLRRSDRADFQSNIAMGLAKKLGRAPRDVAAAIVAKLEVDDICESVDIAGPGFVNLTLRNIAIDRELHETSADPRLGVREADAKERVVIDYSAPNVAKEMHVGHIRSTVLGDALARSLEFLGHDVVRQNHLGDWGTPFGMLIEHLRDGGETASAADFSAGDLNAFYKEARSKFDRDEAFAERSRARVVALQAGDEETLGLWRLLVDGSKRHFDGLYTRLGVTLSDADIRGESFYNTRLAETASELERLGLARISDGALCIFPPGFTGREGEPLPLLVRKQDGGYGYGATDMAAIRYRTTELQATRLIYVVGSPQAQHLAMVFASARLAGWLVPPARAEHVAFGSILGADKKMFKTRSGETIRLSDLLDEAVARAAAIVAVKNPDLDEAARAEVAKVIGIGAIKYSDLSNDRIKDYVFDWDRMLAFEGNTAPYLQYAHARIRSIVRRAEEPSARAGAIVVRHPKERALALTLLAFGGAVEAVGSSLEPHRLCTYLFELATTFTAFYEQCPVLKATDETERASRLALCDVTSRVLAKGLGLLGIDAPQTM